VPNGVVFASPGLKAGRGLKHVLPGALERRRKGIARPQGRARIETQEATRIEFRTSSASPGLKAGRGLKHFGFRPSAALLSLHRPASRPGAD